MTSMMQIIAKNGDVNDWSKLTNNVVFYSGLIDLVNKLSVSSIDPLLGGQYWRH